MSVALFLQCSLAHEHVGTVQGRGLDVTRMRMCIWVGLVFARRVGARPQIRVIAMSALPMTLAHFLVVLVACFNRK